MSLISEYRATEEALKELSHRLESLRNDEALQKELDFEKKLRALMAEYGRSLRDIIALLDPQVSTRATATAKQSGSASKQRRERKVKTYKNPHNGEIIETKGGNHKTLKEWKAQHGADEVESWSSIQG